MSVDVNKCDGDSLVCGLYADDCEVCRGPILRAASGQPGTLAEQLSLALRPGEQARQAELMELVEEVVRRVLVEELPDVIAYILERRATHAA